MGSSELHWKQLLLLETGLMGADFSGFQKKHNELKDAKTLRGTAEVGNNSLWGSSLKSFDLFLL